jgi:hypothetical protein
VERQILFGNFERSIFRQVALTPKPVFHVVAQAIERHPRSDLKYAISDRQRVVEDRIIGETAHGEVVEPLDRTRVQLSLLLEFDFDFSREHGQRAGTKTAIGQSNFVNGRDYPIFETYKSTSSLSSVALPGC